MRSLEALLLSVVAIVLMAPQSLGSEMRLPDKLEGHGGPIRSITVSDDGKSALTGSFDYSIIYWSLEASSQTVRKVLLGHRAAVNDVAFVPDSKLAVSGGDDGAFGIWNLETGDIVALIAGSEEKILSVAVSPDGSLGAGAKWDGSARLYDLKSKREIGKLEHRTNVHDVVFSDDGRQLYTASYDGEIQSWPVDGGTETSIYSHGWGINVLALLPDSRLAFGSLDGTVGIVDPETREAVIVGSFARPILSIDVHEGGGIFALGSADGYIRVVDIDSLEVVEEHHEPYGPVWALAILPDGKNIYRAGLDDFAFRWQIEPRQPFERTASVFPRRFQIEDTDDPGEIEFLRKCSICHTLTPDGANRAGPTLHGLFGRKAGTVAGYAYSEALRDSSIIWTEETVGQLFDDGPDVVVPGTKMPIQRLKAVERRDALIDYLKRATEAVSEKENSDSVRKGAGGIR